MYDIQPLPDLIVHAQFKLISRMVDADPGPGQVEDVLPPGARRAGVINLSALKFLERPDLPAYFHVITGCTMSRRPGLAFRHIDVYERFESDPRMDVYLLLHFEIENTSDQPISVTGASPLIVTISGIGAAIAPEDFVPQAQRVITNSTTSEIVAKGMDDVSLGMEWVAFAAPESPGGGSAPQTVALASHNLTVPGVAGRRYLVSADFSANGTFDSAMYETLLQTNYADSIVTEEKSRKTSGKSFWIIEVPNDLPAEGEEDEDIPDPTAPEDFIIQLSARMRGWGWTGDSTTGVSATWSAPVELPGTALFLEV